MTLAIALTGPALAVAQDATPAVDASCVPMVDTVGCLPVAPDSARVDLERPTFSDPTTITNPLFPVSDLHSVLMLGHVDGLGFRTEVTLLPWTQIIEWDGQQVEALASQYVAYLDGRIEEIAIDYYAQADDGAVWYLGEDVTDYVDGEVVSTDGTWRVGRAGAPAAMIMPGNPQVGDVFRPENIPGFVFEEVEVIRVDATFDGPHGPVSGAIVVSELHQDGTYSDKLFAPGYGEFRTGHLTELEALALAVPADALADPIPAELETLSTGALDLFDAAEAEDWAGAAVTIDAMSAAWDAYRAGDVPPMIEAELGSTFVELAGAVDAQSMTEVRQVSIDVAQLTFDLRLRYQPTAEIDLARLDLWARQVVVDAESDEAGGVTNDVTTLETIRDRVAHVVDGEAAGEIDAALDELRAAADDEDLMAAVEAATGLQEILSTVTITT